MANRDSAVWLLAAVAVAEASTTHRALTVVQQVDVLRTEQVLRCQQLLRHLRFKEITAVQRARASAVAAVAVRQSLVHRAAVELAAQAVQVRRTTSQVLQRITQVAAVAAATTQQQALAASAAVVPEAPLAT